MASFQLNLCKSVPERQSVLDIQEQEMTVNLGMYQISGSGSC